jgi:AraC-like DNA-binding protein
MACPNIAKKVIPVSLPGLRVAQLTTDELRVGVKEYYAVSRLESGRTEWWAKGKLWSAEPGSIQLKQPGDVHRDVAHDGPITFQVVLLAASDFERIGDEGKIVAHPHLGRDDERAGAFHRLHDAIAEGADRLTLEVAATEAVAAYAQLKSTASHHTRPVRRAIEYLREHLADATTLDDLALHADLDKFHLCRAFRAQVGMPPHAYLTHLRITRAKQLLKEGVRASLVAQRVGLYDQSQLNRHFRRIVGTTPARHANSQSW